MTFKISLSYSGGTSRGGQLASFFQEDNSLHQFFLKNDFWWVMLLQKWLHHTKKIRRAKPTERYLVMELLDRMVARRLQPGADFLLVESQMALQTIRRAKQLGMVTLLDRTNSHIQNQSEVWGEENRKHGIKWMVNSRAVIQKGIREYEETDHIIALSGFVQNSLVQRGVSQEKIIKVLPGINLNSFQPAQKTDNIFRIIFCGAIQNKKGIHYLLEAFKQLNLPNSELCLIGSVVAEFSNILDQYKGYYKLVGPIKNKELHNWYTQGSVFVLPSLEEGFAKVMLEAQACGLPVIATTNTGAEDLIENGKNGFVVPIRSVESLKQQLTYLHENPERASAMGRHGREKVLDYFTLDHYAERLKDALNELQERKD